jgi:hypothetical protein
MLTRTLRSAATAAALLVVAACASSRPEPIHRENLEQIRANVVEIRKSERLVTLQAPDSSTTVTVEMGPEVRNFDQIQVGDSLVVSYYQSISFTSKDPNEPVPPGTFIVGSGRAPEGARPGAAGAIVSEVVVTFQTYDDTTRIVTFTDETGRAHAATVKREDGRQFAMKLRRGDRVAITATDAVAVMVEAGK